MTPEESDIFWNTVNRYPLGWQRTYALRQLLLHRLKQLTKSCSQPWRGTIEHLCGRKPHSTLEGKAAARELRKLEQEGFITRLRKKPARHLKKGTTYTLLRPPPPTDWKNPTRRKHHGIIPPPPADLPRSSFPSWHMYHIYKWMEYNSEDGIWTGRTSLIPISLTIATVREYLHELENQGNISTLKWAGSRSTDRTIALLSEPPEPQHQKQSQQKQFA